MSEPETRKNIVLCSDGTGQAGTVMRGTNVWKVRMGVKRYDHEKDSKLRRQIVFYDNGVGTSKFSVKAMLGTAFGYGLANNMRRLYTNLCKTYREGDYLYIFGFSRGAFTARSLAGMISEVGVIDGQRDNLELEDLVRRAYKAYRASKRKDPIGRFQKECADRKIRIHQPRIHFVGVWDTVDAYGMPVDELRDWIYGLINWFRRPHNDQLTDKMDNAYHAMAIDEDRRTFSPTLYDEANAHGAKVEQVWFAGAHSNVGGGYPRQGLSDVALRWMMVKAQACGLRFSAAAQDEVLRRQDVHSTLYDQRSGPGVIWRYLPRNIGRLCREAGINRPKVHVSVMDRIELATADYGPITLPADFEVVGTTHEDDRAVARYSGVAAKSAPDRQESQTPAWREIGRRRLLYQAFLVCLLVVAVVAVALLVNEEKAIETYRKYSLFTRAGHAVAQKAPGLADWVVKPWGWIQSAGEAVAPGPFKKLAKAAFQLPEYVILVVVIVVILLTLQRRRIAALRHLGLNMWARAFRDG